MDKKAQSLRAKPTSSTSPRVVQRLLAARALDESYHSDLEVRPNDGRESEHKPRVVPSGDPTDGKKRFNPATAGAVLSSMHTPAFAAEHSGEGVDLRRHWPKPTLQSHVEPYVQTTFDFAEEVYGYDDRDYFANFQLGYVLETKADYFSAEAHFRKAARTDVPDLWVDAVFHLATCLQRQGKVDEALKWYSKLKPSDSNSYRRNVDFERASILLVQNQLDAAIDILEILMLQRPFDGYVVWSLAAAYYQRGTRAIDSSETAAQSQFPVSGETNPDVAACVELYWYLENIVRSHPVESGRWKGGVDDMMQKNLCFLSHQTRWQERRAAVAIQTRTRGVLARARAQRLRTHLALLARKTAASLRFQAIVRMKLAMQLRRKMMAFRAAKATMIQALIRASQDRERLRSRLEAEGIVVFYFPLDVERVEFHPKTGKPVWTRSEFMQTRHKLLSSKKQRVDDEESLKLHLLQKNPAPPSTGSKSSDKQSPVGGAEESKVAPTTTPRKTEAVQ